MKDITVKDYTFMKKEQAVTVTWGSSSILIKVYGPFLLCLEYAMFRQVDPQLLFQRLITVTATNGLSEELDLPSVFEYELSCPPAALFDPSVVCFPCVIHLRVSNHGSQVDPQLLFQGLITVTNGLSEELDLPSVFEYELSCPPAALFDPSGLLREPDKAKLTDALVSAASQESEKDIVDETSDIEYVLDGGSLLHRIPWRRSDTFAAIGQTYVEYVQRMYTKPRIAFDDNDGQSTNDAPHLQRSCGVIGLIIRLNPEIVCNARKERFLANPNNKQAFVQYLGDVLEKDGCEVLHAQGDADTLIVRTAVSCAINKTTVVIGEDTDLLVLLLHHANIHNRPLLLKYRSNTKKHKQIDILSMKIRLGPLICHLLPFLHAINGCDTTSRLIGHYF
ncbi:LOW QUALITY PROTEIN: hypothetical protein PoB_000678400 [Plakobranchus ocellatus]|uniref:NYN domain-containing protein n=1 Tax=Plakobranchus ocellatus TaxID=259542 RepID=A0AAV3YB91_9GAST|nr:LOW QUALITY PROTEIN: hypothetical protein PoB_000678400 [Plakobranchus ocellatus]